MTHWHITIAETSAPHLRFRSESFWTPEEAQKHLDRLERKGKLVGFRGKVFEADREFFVMHNDQVIPQWALDLESVG